MPRYDEVLGRLGQFVAGQRRVRYVPTEYSTFLQLIQLRYLRRGLAHLPNINVTDSNGHAAGTSFIHAR